MSPAYRNTAHLDAMIGRSWSHIRISHKGLAPTVLDRNLGWESRGRKNRLRSIWMGGRVCCITVWQIMGTAGPRTITSSCKQKRIPIPFSKLYLKSTEPTIFKSRHVGKYPGWAAQTSHTTTAYDCSIQMERAHQIIIKQSHNVWVLNRCPSSWRLVRQDPAKKLSSQ